MEKGRDFLALHEHSRGLIRGAASVPVTCDPLVVYSYGIEATSEAAIELATIAASNVAWRVCSSAADSVNQCYGICGVSGAETAYISLAPHNTSFAEKWRHMLADHVASNGSGIIDGHMAAQLEHHIPDHSVGIAPGRMLVTHGWMPWRPDSDCSARVESLKIYRLSFRNSREVFPVVMSEESASAPVAVAAAPAVDKPKSYDAARELETELLGRIEALDARVWDPKNATNVAKASAELASVVGTPRSKDVTRFCNLLVTMGRRVTEAEDAEQNKLPELLASLAEMRASLDQLMTNTSLGPMFCKRRDSQLAKCAELQGVTSNLVARAKMVTDCAAATQKLVADVEAKAAATPAAVPRPRAPKRPAAAAAEPTVTGRAPPPLQVPTVDVTACTPMILTGKAQWMDALVRFAESKLLQAMVIQHNSNTKITDLWNHYQAAIKPILNLVKNSDKAAQEVLQIDFTETAAYFAALQQVYEAANAAPAATATTKRAAVAASTAPAPTSKRGVCEGCEEPHLLFCEGRCRECFVDEMVAERMDELNDKLRNLHALADDEDEDPDAEDGRGPYQVLSDQMDSLHDQIEAKFAALSERTGRYSQWEDLKGLLAVADQHLDALPPPDNAMEENDDDNDDDDEDNNKEKGGKKKGMWDDAPEPADDYDQPAVSTPSGSQEEDSGRRASKNSHQYELADAAMRIMHAVPVASIHKKLLTYYNDGRLDSVACLVRETRDRTKEIYGIKVTNLATGISSDWPTHYEEYDDALAHMARANVDGVMKGEVVKKSVVIPDAVAPTTNGKKK